MKKIIYLFISLFVITSCAKEVDNTKSLPVDKDKDAVLIYMGSDNNLYPYAVKNIGVMESMYDENAPKQILVYLDVLNGDAQLMRIVPTPRGQASRSEILKTYTKPNSSDPKVLDQVIRDAQTSIGSNRISDIVLWSHGRAWIPYNYYPIISVRDEVAPQPVSDGITLYSFGSDNSASGDEMNVHELVGVLSKYKFDNILFDACYMSSIELLYELRNNADCIVASPAEVLADGFAYSVITPMLVAAKLNGPALSKAYFDFYNAKSGPSRSATIAAVDCSKLEALAAAVKTVVDKYAAVINNDDMRAKVGQYDRNGSNQYLYDLKTYLTQIINTYAGASASSELAAFNAAFDAVILYEGHTPSMIGELSLEGTYGISGYIPNSSSAKYISNMYFKTLEWGSASGLSNPIFFTK